MTSIFTPTERTLRDRLSRLNFVQAAKLLNPNGAKLLQDAGRRFAELSPDRAKLSEERLEVSLADARVAVFVSPFAVNKLAWSCSAKCKQPCPHVAAAFSLVLEEKTALGLAKPPEERAPIESLSETELVRRALDERAERAKTEKLSVRSKNAGAVWTEYDVSNPATGRTYRVSLRGWERGQSYCSCPDFRKNTLGTCKHILRVIEQVKRKPGAKRAAAWKPECVEVWLSHQNGNLALRVNVPENLPAPVAKFLQPLADKPVANVRALVDTLKELDKKQVSYNVFADAEEYIDAFLFRERIAGQVAEIRRDPANHPLRKALLKTELLPYQLDGIAFAAGAGRAILADDMGLGKTIQGVGVAELLAFEAGIQRVLIICPASLKSQWHAEIRRFSGRPVQIVQGSAEERAAQYGAAFFSIANYEQILRDLPSVRATEWDLIILDEAQRVKNWEAATTRVIQSLKSRFALALSGTPLENRLEELFTVASFIDDRRLGPAFRFLNTHRVTDERGKVLGYKNLDQLRKNLAPILLRRTRASVIQQLPSRSTEIIRVIPSEEQLEIHNGHLRIVSGIVKKSYINEMDLLRLRKALLMCRMAANATTLVDKQPKNFSTKLEALDELLGKLLAESDRKILIFSEWTSMLDLIEPLLKKHKAGFVRLDGSVPQNKRQPIIQKFQNDPACSIFLTSNAGSTGLNLQAANTIINVDLPWNPAVLEQRIGRAHRMGQTRPVQVYLLVTQDTLEEKLLSTLDAKRDLALAALDSESTTDSISMVTGMDDLKNRLEVLLGQPEDAAIKQEPDTPTSQPAEPTPDVPTSQPADQPLPDQTTCPDNVANASHLPQNTQRLQAAGNQLITAALGFLNELLHKNNEENKSQNPQISTSLNPQISISPNSITIPLPEPAVLNQFATLLSAFLKK